jgi:hypothetical protein
MTEKKRKKSPRDRTRLDREFWERYDETTRRLLERIGAPDRKPTDVRTPLDSEFWERYDETTRRLEERIAYHARKAAEERAAREAAGDAA